MIKGSVLQEDLNMYTPDNNQNMWGKNSYKWKKK